MNEPKLYLQVLKYLSTRGLVTYHVVSQFFSHYRPSVPELLFVDEPQQRAMYDFLDYMRRNGHLNYRASNDGEQLAEATITVEGLEYYIGIVQVKEPRY